MVQMLWENSLEFPQMVKHRVLAFVNVSGHEGEWSEQLESLLPPPEIGESLNTCSFRQTDGYKDLIFISFVLLHAVPSKPISTSHLPKWQPFYCNRNYSVLNNWCRKGHLRFSLSVVTDFLGRESRGLPCNLYMQFTLCIFLPLDLIPIILPLQMPPSFLSSRLEHPNPVKSRSNSTPSVKSSLKLRIEVPSNSVALTP